MKILFHWIAGGLLAAGLAGGCRSATANAPEEGYIRLGGAEVFSARYDADASTLTLVSRRGESWRYEGVPAAVADALRLTENPDACWREQVDGKFKRVEL